MKILALDTATEACSVALLIDGRLIARELEFERGHAEHILPMVDAVLAEAGLPLAAMDALAFGRGPGGFTGVRLAASVTQGLAFAADLPVVPISDLLAVAQRAFDLQPAFTRMLVCNDARMHEVYWACFEHAAPIAAERGPSMSAEGGVPAVLTGAEHVGPPASITLPTSWTCAPPGAAAGAIGAAGRGFRAYPELRSKLLSASDSHPAVVHLISDEILPRAHEIAHLAVAEVQAGRALAAESAIPVYLRDDVARPPPS
jgi:tRNA threonylcarbamoyladenosine biosynthesis protein TsaB